MWSSHPDEQDVLADTPLGHIVPDDDAPYAGVVVNNLGGNKLLLYLQREIDYTADSCSGDTRATTVKVRLPTHCRRATTRSTSPGCSTTIRWAHRPEPT